MFRSAFLLTAFTGCLAAQEEPLRQAFEGKTVIVKIDMPGDDDGVNLFPQRQDPIDPLAAAAALKRYGTSVRQGERVKVTKVHVKPKLIEFQLGGGGFGSKSDLFFRPSTPSSHVSKSSHERNLEKAREGATGDRRAAIDRQLESERRRRQHKDSENRRHEPAAKTEREEWETRRRLGSGSRFNIHYPGGVPPDAATPNGVRAALAGYVDFRNLE